MQGGAVISLIAFVFFAVPGSALAAKAEVVGAELRFVAAAGEVNDAGIQSTSSGELSFYDNTKSPTAGPGCRKQSASEGGGVACSAQGVTSVTVDLGDRSDRFGIETRPPALSLSGGSGTDSLSYGGGEELGPATVSLDGVANDGRDGRDNVGSDIESIDGTFLADKLTGGLKPVSLKGDEGDDELAGGQGNDYVSAAYVSESGIDLGQLYPEGKDNVTCGAGNDMVFADHDDTIAGDCEVIGRPSSADRYAYAGSKGSDRIGVREFVVAIVRAKGGNDVISLPGQGNGSLYGDAGNDSLRGATGADRFYGGSGNDKINARDRERDKVSCGAGKDRVTADRSDRVARDCEKVSRR